jgi:hypothetical protein
MTGLPILAVVPVSMIEADSETNLELKNFIMGVLVFIGIGNLIAILQSEKGHNMTVGQKFCHFILNAVITFYGVSFGLCEEP